MRQLSYEDQKTLLALSIDVFQSGSTRRVVASDGGLCATTLYNPVAVKKLEMFCMEKLGTEGCKEFYSAWLEDLKEERK